MNIMILINSFNLGGAEKLCYDIAEDIQRRGYNVYLVAMAEISTSTEKEVIKNLKKKNINVFSINKRVGKDRLKCILNIRNYLVKYNIDILHTNGQSPDYFGRIAAGTVRNCKVVVSIHNSSGYNRKRELILNKFTEQYIAVSNPTKEYMQSDLKIKKDIKVIDNGIEIDRYINTKISNDTFNILSVGRVMKQKNYHEITEEVSQYLKKNINAKWIIVGDIDQEKECYKLMLSKIDKRVMERVIFTGVVSNPEKYYKSADCFLLNSLYEGFGIVFVEAMIAKLPIITNRVGIVPEIIDKGGWICLLEDNSIADYLTYIRENKNEVNKKLIRNFEIAKRDYSINSTVDKYLDVYKKIASSKID